MPKTRKCRNPCSFGAPSFPLYSPVSATSYRLLISHATSIHCRTSLMYDLRTSHLRNVVIRQDNDLRICIAKRFFMQMLHKQNSHAMCSLSYISDVRPNILLLSYHSIPHPSITFPVQYYIFHPHACGFPHPAPFRYRLLSCLPVFLQTVPAFPPVKLPSHQ